MIVKPPRILVVDDEAAIRFGVNDFLLAHGFEVELAENIAQARELVAKSVPDAVVADYLLPDGNALDLLPRLREHGTMVPTVILTAHGSIDLAVRCVKEGAEQFLTKPIELAALLVILQRMLENQRQKRRALLEDRVPHDGVPEVFLGTSSAIRRLAEQARRTAEADVPVLIQGETGTGKTVLARWIHANSPRREETFVDINCAALSPEFLQAELFGYEAGAFTGANARKLGLLEVGHKGTVFLDEIGDVDLAVQPKLLKVIEEKTFRRLGSVRDIFVDNRLVVATNQDLSKLVEEKRFRSDLYFRTSTVRLTCAPLRERREDIPVLARHLLKELGRSRGLENPSLTEAAEQTLVSYAWPGNIRELRNVLERALLLCGRVELDKEDLQLDTASKPLPTIPEALALSTSLTLIEVQKLHILRVLREEQGHVERAAKRLKVPRSSLYQKLKRLGIAPTDRQ